MKDFIDRRYERIYMVAEVVMDSSAGRRTSRISDLSLGGCYIESITNFREGESVSFDLQKPDGSTVRFSGTVAYFLEGFGFGLTFTNIGPQQLEFLKQSIPGQLPFTQRADDLLEIW